MELQQILEQLSASAVRSILAEHAQLRNENQAGAGGAEQEHHIGSSRERLSQLLTDQRQLHCVYRSLSVYERDVLHHFIYNVGQDLLTYRQIAKLDGKFKPLSFRLGLTGLRRKGLIYTVRRQWGEEAYLFPAEIESKLYYTLHQDGIFSKVLSSAGADAERKEQEVQAEQGFPVPAVIQDIFRILDLMRSEGFFLPLTQKRTIHKRVVRQIEDQLCCQALQLQAFHLASVHGEVYSAYLSLLLDFLTRERVLLWRAESVELDRQRVVQWLDDGCQPLREAFLTYWVKTLSPQEKWLERYVKDMFLLRHTSEWYGWLESVEMWEHHYALPPIRDVIDHVGAVLSPLVQLGLVQTGTTAEGERMWRWVKWHDRSDPPYVQPNLEMLCSGLLSLGKLWEYTQLCNVMQWDAMLQLTLSEKRVKAYLDQGANVTAWIRMLEQDAATPVPSSWSDRLEQWQKKKRMIALQEVVMLECQEPELARALEAWLEAERLPFQALPERLFIVPLRLKDTVLDLLQQKDIFLQLVEAEKQTDDPEIPVSFFAADLDRAQLKIESVFPSYEEAIPEWGRIPQAWKKQFSTYHKRTVRDIVQYAVDHRLMLRIEQQSGRLLQITPFACQQRDGTWVVEAEGKDDTALHDIKRIQVVLPDLNET